MKKWKIKAKLLAVACVPIIVVILVTTAYGLDLQPKIDPLAQPLIEEDIAVGFMIGIVKDGQTQVMAYGEKTKGSRVKPDADTVYEIGSISKVFTGILLADMVQKGIVKLEDPVQKYLPPDMKMPIADDKPITLEHIVTHTSGLPRMPDNFAPADPANPFADYSESQMYAFLEGHKLRRLPGQYEYSNYGMGLLGHLLAKKMGKTYEQYLIEQISEPLGMLDTSITLNEDQQARLATPYDGALNPAKPWDIPTLAGAGGIRSTCNDMIKFIKANLKDDDNPFTQAIHMSHQKRHTINGGMAIGFAWHINPDDTRWHNGGTGGFHSWLGISLSQKVGVVVLVNTSSMRFTQFGEKVMQVALGQEVEPLEIRKAISISPDVLESYTGEYTLAPSFILTVTVEEGKLMVQATGQAKYQVFPESETKFFYKVVDAQISFVPDEDGKISHLILHQGGLNQKAFRKGVLESRKSIDVSPDVLESYTGEYTLAPSFILTVTVEEGKLMVQATGQAKYQVFPESETKFFYKVVDAQISFVPDEDGRIDHLILHQGGRDQKAVRKNEGF